MENENIISVVGQPQSSPNDLNKKRSDYIEWPEYFMAIAFLSAQRSKDPGSQVGACIVNRDKKIVGIGYNGMPNGCDDDKLPWRRTAENRLDTKYPYVCHAEMNAIMNKNSADLKDCIMYVALFPCNECAKLVIQSGISQIIYVSDKYHDKPDLVASRRLLDLAGVTYKKFEPKRKRLVIDFDVIDSVPVQNQLPDSLSDKVLKEKNPPNDNVQSDVQRQSDEKNLQKLTKRSAEDAGFDAHF